MNLFSKSLSSNMPTKGAPTRGAGNRFFTIFCGMIVALFLSVAANAATLQVDDDGAQCAGAYSSIPAAYAAANSGDTIQVCSGTYLISSTINLTKTGLTLIGVGATRPVIQIPQSTGYGFTIQGANTTFDNLEIVKSDDTVGVHNLILVQANNFTAQNNLIYGPSYVTLSATTRAFEVTGGLTGLLIQNNTIHSLRQPAYINGGSPRTTGSIINNHVSGTKGWVIDGATLNFTGNSWGPPANATDIALLASCNPADYNLYQLRANNNNAVVSAQYATPTVVSPANLNGWSSVSQRTAGGSFVTGPATPPLGVGSYRMVTGAGNSGPDLPQGGAGTGGKTWFTTQQYDSTLLSNINSLSYKTYISSSPSSTTIEPVLEFQVDLDGDGARDAAMNFEPIYSTVSNGGSQPNIAPGVWQTWDAAAGKWWFSGSSFTNAGTFAFCPTNCYVTLPQIIAAYPNAKIVTWYPLADGYGTQFIAGQNSAGAPWANFDGNIDDFQFNTSSTSATFDFEPNRPSVTINQASGQADPTSTQPVHFTVTFSEPVTGFDASDVVIGGTANPTTKTVTGGPTVYDVAVGGAMTSGTITATVNDSGATSTASSAPNTASTSTDNSVTYFTCNNVAAPIGMTSIRNATLTIPISTDDVSNRGILSFDYGFTYNPNTITPLATPYDQAGTLSAGMTITTNIITNSPTSKTLLVSGFGSSYLSGSGTLINLKFTANGAVGTSSPLAFSSFRYNEGVPCVNTTNGSYSVISGNITGQVTYANASSTRAVPNATLTASGSVPKTAVTDNNGQYTLSGLGSGPYTVTPSKTGDDMSAITAYDAALIAQHVVQISTLTTQAQLDSADTSGNGVITSYDAGLIARYVVHLSATGLTGMWKFTPVNRTYPDVETDKTNQDYSSVLIGEVSGNWAGSGMRAGAASDEGAKDENTLRLSAPEMSGEQGSNIAIPVTISNTTGKRVISYQFEVAYNPEVLQAQDSACDVADTVSASFSATCNSTEIGVLRVAVFGSLPATGAGSLIKLNFRAVGAINAQSTVGFRNVALNEGFPFSSATDGKVTITPGRADAVSLTGQLLNGTGLGIGSARVTLTSSNGETRSAMSNGMGLYRFDNLAQGETYTLSVSAKRYVFTPQAISVAAGVNQLNMTAQQ
jgi:Carboxypeptidase regulatory-like domain/Dockerin type I domain